MENAAQKILENKPQIPDRGIWIASLADYNAGRLLGAWVDLDAMTDSDDLDAEVEKMLERSKEENAEEYAVHDYNGIPNEIVTKLGEWPDWDELLEIVEALNEHGDAVVEAAMGCRIPIADISDAYRGTFNTQAEFGMDYAENNMEIPDAIRQFIDYAAIAHDATCGEYMECETDDGFVYFVV